MASFRLCCVERLCDESVNYQLRSIFLCDQTPYVSGKKDNEDGRINDRSGLDPVVHLMGSCHLVLAVHRWTENGAAWRVLYSGTKKKSMCIKSY